MSQFGDLQKHKDQSVEISGTVTEYRNKPKIILEKPARLKMEKSATARCNYLRRLNKMDEVSNMAKEKTNPKNRNTNFFTKVYSGVFSIVIR